MIGTLSCFQSPWPSRPPKLKCRYKAEVQILQGKSYHAHFSGFTSFPSMLYNFIYLFTFGYAGSSLLGGLFSRCGGQGLLSSCNAQASHCGGFSCCGAQALACMGSESPPPGSPPPGSPPPGSPPPGSRAVAHGLSCPTAHGALPDHGLNPCLLHWRVGSVPPSPQGRLPCYFRLIILYCQDSFLLLLV